MESERMFSLAYVHGLRCITGCKWTEDKINTVVEGRLLPRGIWRHWYIWCYYECCCANSRLHLEDEYHDYVWNKQSHTHTHNDDSDDRNPYPNRQLLDFHSRPIKRNQIDYSSETNNRFIHKWNSCNTMVTVGTTTNNFIHDFIRSKQSIGNAQYVRSTHTQYTWRHLWRTGETRQGFRTHSPEWADEGVSVLRRTQENKGVTLN